MEGKFCQLNDIKYTWLYNNVNISYNLKVRKYSDFIIKFKADLLAREKSCKMFYLIFIWEPLSCWIRNVDSQRARPACTLNAAWPDSILFAGLLCNKLIMDSSNNGRCTGPFKVIQQVKG